MRFEVGEVLTLADKKDYVISNAKTYEGAFYMLLIELPDYKSFKYVKLVDEETLSEIDDVDLVIKLSKVFIQN